MIHSFTIRTVSLMAALYFVCPLTGHLALALGEEAEKSAAPAIAVKLLAPGKGPRRSIRFNLQKGATQTVVLTLRTTMSMSVNGQALASPKMPAQAMTLEFLVTEVKPNGDTTYSVKFKAVDLTDTDGIPAPLLESLRAKLKPIVGMSGEVEMTNRGMTKRVEIGVPENADPGFEMLLGSVRQTLSQASSALPEEAVGVGGKWNVVQTLDVNSMNVTQTLSQEVLEFQGSSVKLKTIITQTAVPQEVSLPGMPAGARAQLLSLDSNGGGQTLVDVARIMPNNAQISGTTNTKMEISLGARKQTMDMQMKMDIELSGDGKAKK